MLDVAPHLSLAVLLSWLQFQISGQLAQQGLGTFRGIADSPLPRPLDPQPHH